MKPRVSTISKRRTVSELCKVSLIPGLGLLQPLKADLQEINLSELGYHLTTWTVEDEIPATYVDSLGQSSDGYLWWESNWGVVRFDGVRATPFIAPLAPGDRSTTVRFIHFDQDRELWASGGEDVAKFDGSQLRWKRDLPGAAKGWGGFVEDSSGGLWIHVLGPNGRRLVRVDDKASGQEIELGDFREPVSFAFSGTELWASGHTGVRKVWSPDGTTGSTPFGPQSSVFFHMPDGTLGVVTQTGIYLKKSSEWELVRVFPEGGIQSRLIGQPVAVDQDENIWFSARDGRLRVATHNGRYHCVRLPKEFPNGANAIRSIFCDNEQSIWIGSSEGVHQLHYVSFGRKLETPSADKEMRLVDLAFRPDGEVWAVTAAPGGGTVVRYSDVNEEGEVIPGTFGALQIESDLEGNIWVGAVDRVMCFKFDGEREAIRFPRFERVYSLAVSQGVAWMATDRGIFRSMEETFVSDGPPRNEQKGFTAVDVHATGDQVWCYQEGGFHRKNSGSRWEEFDPPQWGNAHLPNCLEIDDQGRLWSGGVSPALICHDGQQWINVINERHGIPIEVLDVSPDLRGGLWILTQEHGVALLEFDDGDLSKPKVHWFSTEDGLPSVFGQGWGKGASASPDGRIWVATRQGIGVIDPAKWAYERNRSPIPNVHIERLLVNDVPAVMGQDGVIDVPASGNRLEIQYTALGLKGARKNQFRYRLEGWDDDWIRNGTRRSVVYQRIAPGSYRFQVSGANSDGVWNHEGASIMVIVHPHWWQREDVRLGGLLVTLALIFLVLRIRTKNLHAKNALRERFSRKLLSTQEEERKKIAHELHDSLGQEMLVLKGRLDLAAMKNAELQAPLTALSRNLSETIERARQLSHDLRPPHLEHFGLSKALEALVNDLSEASTFAVTSNIEDLVPRLSPELEIGLFRIAQEACSNVLKHAEATTLSLALERRGDRVRLAVEDDGGGFGFEDSRLGTTLGLSGMEERASLLGGVFKCESTPGKGTVIKVSVPFKGDYDD